MLNMSTEKLALVSWLYENDQRSYQNPRKLQKFLFFYELFSKVMGEQYEFGGFKVWLNGPVDSFVYGDYTYRQDYLVSAIKQADQKAVNQEIATKADFLVKILNKEEISDLTHDFDLWKKPAASENFADNNVKLNETYFSKEDELTAKELFFLYDEEMIKDSTVLHVLGKHFVLSNGDVHKLSKENEIVLNQLATDDLLKNPVFVEVDEKGGLIID
ncbi:MAG: hypothetical protein LBT37_06560 [Lactobacillaceae bacterium]|nr:hypothetical protein [Lactobacillaceae bacterium]